MKLSLLKLDRLPTTLRRLLLRSQAICKEGAPLRQDERKYLYACTLPARRAISLVLAAAIARPSCTGHSRQLPPRDAAYCCTYRKRGVASDWQENCKRMCSRSKATTRLRQTSCWATPPIPPSIPLPSTSFPISS